MPNTTLNDQTRAYFLQQGASIAKLQQILDSNLFMHHVRKWTSLLLEVTLYALFIGAVILIIIFPDFLNLHLNNSPDVDLEVKIKQVSEFILLMRLLLFLFTLPILLFAILLGRNRKKNTLIRKAYTEVKKMKEGFDVAVRNFGL